jgi:hypothetical protein
MALENRECWLVRALCVMAGLYAGLLGYSALMRVRWVSDQTRRASRWVNRRVGRIAGTRWGSLYFNLGVLHHFGRRSGQEYATPLSAYPLGEGFVVAIAYPQVDWAKNVLAEGKCSLTWRGQEYSLERPEQISRSEALKAYPLLVKPFLLVPGTKEFLWLHPSVAKPRLVETVRAPV